MGFFRAVLDAGQNIVTLGGHARRRHYQREYEELSEIYLRLLKSINDGNKELVCDIARIRGKVKKCTRSLKRAKEMIAPSYGAQKNSWFRSLRGKVSHFRPSSTEMLKPSVRFTSEQLGRSQAPRSLRDELNPVLIGTGAGATVSAASWGAVQVAAHASTGAAMAGLHGAAATNAGWAWFGGGSVATGGGGMALGHFVLPGIGTAVAVAVSATLAHQQANKLAEGCRELKRANWENRGSLQKLNANLIRVRGIQSKLDAEHDYLKSVIRRTRKRLFRFGIFSHWYRILRSWFGGVYYRDCETQFIEQLDRTCSSFISAFRDV